MKLDRQEAQYRPAVYQNRGRGCAQRQNNYELETGPIVKKGIIPTTEVEETFITLTEVIGPTIEIEVDQEITAMEIAIEEVIIPKTIEEIIIDKTMVTKGTEIGTEVQVGTMVGQDRGIEAIPRITPETGHMTEVKVEIERERESRNRDRSSSREEGQRLGTESRDRDRSREREGRSTARSKSSSRVNTNRDRLR